MSTAIPSPIVALKPVWRGRLHLAATHIWPFVALLLLVVAGSSEARKTALVYGAGVFVMFAASANLHRGRWPSEALRRRIDHACIFIGIASSSTPMMTAAKAPAIAWAMVWGCAVLGAALKLVWADQPELVGGGIYLVFGVVAWAAPLTGAVPIPAFVLGLMLASGALDVAGGVLFAIQRPRWEVAVWGGHEWFHLLVTLARIPFTLAVGCWAHPTITAVGWQRIH